jgi:predicted DNA-binding ribbon-helix-helix protein
MEFAQGTLFGRPPRSEAVFDGAAEERWICLGGRGRWVWLESEYWDALDDMAAREGRGFAALVQTVNNRRGRRPLDESLRGYVLAYFRGLTYRRASLAVAAAA